MLPKRTSPAAPTEADRGELDAFTLRRAQRGDRTAQAAFIAMYGRRVTALVGRILVGAPEAVDDTVQDAFVKLLGQLERCDPAGPARVSTWVLTVATRVALDRLRRRRVEQRSRGESAAEPVVGLFSGSAVSPERRAMAQHLGARVAAAMAELPDDQRAVLVLRAYHDLDYDEIAAALTLEVGTVKSRLARAREALRQAVPEGTHE